MWSIIITEILIFVVLIFLFAVTAGSSGKTEDAVTLIEDMDSAISEPKSDDTGLEILIWRRVTVVSKAIKKFSTLEENGSNFHSYGTTYFQLMVLEFLYMYNFLPSCSDEHLEAILDGMKINEPMFVKFLVVALYIGLILKSSHLLNFSVSWM